MNTHTRKTHWGWQTESQIQISDTMRLNIVTMKRHTGVLATTAQASHKEGNFYSYEPYKDYSKQVLHSNPSRCTRQTVEMQHSRVMANVDVLVEAVENFYGVTA